MDNWHIGKSNINKINFMPPYVNIRAKKSFHFQVAIEINIWRDTSDNNFLKSLPIAEILECVGFVAILLVESIAHGMHPKVESIPEVILSRKFTAT